MATTAGNIGMVWGWALQENGWKGGMDANLRALDLLPQCVVISIALSAPPVSPADGAAYIVGSSPTGAWAGRANQIARYNSAASAWEFYAPRTGWECFCQNIGRRLRYSGTSWEIGGLGAYTSLEIMGVERISAGGAAYLTALTVSGGSDFSGTIRAKASRGSGFAQLEVGGGGAGNAGILHWIRGSDSSQGAAAGFMASATEVDEFRTSVFSSNSAYATWYLRNAANTSGREVMRLHNSGGLSVGNTTDPGAGGLRLAGPLGFAAPTVYSTDAVRTLPLTGSVVVYNVNQTTTQTVPNGTFVGQTLIIKSLLTSANVSLTGSIHAVATSVYPRTTNVLTWDGSTWY